MVYLFDERSGVMSLIRASPEKYELINEFRTGSGSQSMNWAHPGFYGKRLYVRHWDKVFLYDIGL